MRKKIGAAAALLLTSALMFTGLTPASAATPAVSAPTPTATTTSTTSTEFISALRASAIPRTTVITPGTIEETYTFTDPKAKTLSITIVIPNAGTMKGTALLTPNLTVGANSRTPYVLFNQFDQDALISGAGFFLGLTLCAASPAFCASVTAVIAAAGLFLSYNGKCTYNRQLYDPLILLPATYSTNIAYRVHCV